MHILVVDDDADYALELKKSLKDLGIIDVVHSEDKFRNIFTPYKYDLILLDLRLRKGKEGLDLLAYIIDEDPSAVVIVISGYGDISTAVEALQKGAKTFLEKGRVSPQEIRIRVEHALKESVAERRIKQFEALQEKDEIIGDDPKIRKIRDLIKLVAQDGETTVLIRGETGTGKELVARAVHKTGIRKEGPFISVALTDINPDTITSELFGHERGAFTGAQGRHHGYFEQAHRGVLFMDEIGDLPNDIQIKLLRVLDQKKFRRMGGNEDISVDSQVVTATNRPLEEMLKTGEMRQDLYYRLKVFEIHLPPIRERSADIPLLANHFLMQLRKKGRTPAAGFSDNAVALMLNYRWPGNVRELKSVVESAALRSRLENTEKINKGHIAALLASDDISYGENSSNIFRKLAETELRMVEDALIHSGGRKSEAWKLLNYPNRFTMLRRVKKIISEYPELSDKFPEIKDKYGVME